MRRYAAQVKKPRKIRDLIESLDAFAPRPDRGWLWLQKACFWVLRKIGAHRQDCYEDVVWEEFSPDTILRAVIEQQHCLDELYNMRGATILMGAEDFSRFASLEIDQPFAFVGQIEIGGNRGAMLFGIPVRVLPWMAGVVVVPKEEV